MSLSLCPISQDEAGHLLPNTGKFRAFLLRAVDTEGSEDVSSASC
jgi:hypothetical protein